MKPTQEKESERQSGPRAGAVWAAAGVVATCLLLRRLARRRRDAAPQPVPEAEQAAVEREATQESGCKLETEAVEELTQPTQQAVTAAVPEQQEEQQGSGNGGSAVAAEETEGAADRAQGTADATAEENSVGAVPVGSDTAESAEASKHGGEGDKPAGAEEQKAPAPPEQQQPQQQQQQPYKSPVKEAAEPDWAQGSPDAWDWDFLIKARPGGASPSRSQKKSRTPGQRRTPRSPSQKSGRRTPSGQQAQAQAPQAAASTAASTAQQVSAVSRQLLKAFSRGSRKASTASSRSAGRPMKRAGQQ